MSDRREEPEIERLREQVQRLTEERDARDRAIVRKDEWARKQQKEIDDLKDGLRNVHIDLAVAKRALAAKDDALREIEFIDVSCGEPCCRLCPDCRSAEGNGHNYGCRVAAALGATQGPDVEDWVAGWAKLKSYRDNRVAWSPQNPDAASGGELGDTQKEETNGDS